MQEQRLPLIEVLENSDLTTERESGRTHTPYETEQLFYGCIRSGDVARTEQMMHHLLSQTVVAGKLSHDPLRQMKYWAVCCITLATRAAIAGGLDETTAFNLSDESIRVLDSMTLQQDILPFLQKLCLKLTGLVAQSRDRRAYPLAVRKAIHYIHANLHSKLSLDEIAAVCGLSPDYFGALFKSCVGLPPGAYLRSERLKAARQMLAQTQKSTSEIAYLLGFCSESYFIKCFREAFGCTPGEMRKQGDLMQPDAPNGAQN